MKKDQTQKLAYSKPKVVATYSEQQLFAQTEIDLASGWFETRWGRG